MSTTVTRGSPSSSAGFAVSGRAEPRAALAWRAILPDEHRREPAQADERDDTARVVRALPVAAQERAVGAAVREQIEQPDAVGPPGLANGRPGVHLGVGRDLKRRLHGNPRLGRRPGGDREHRRDPLGEVLRRHEVVDVAVREQVLGRHDLVWQRLAGQRLDHPRTGQADERAGLGERDVRKRRPRGEYAADRRVSQIREREEACVPQPAHRGGGLDHLEEPDAALLHAGAARDRQGEDRQSQLDGSFVGPHDALGRGDALRPRQERELPDDEHRVVAAHRCPAGDDRLVGPGLLGGLRESFSVRNRTDKLERVGVSDLGVPRLERAGVGEERDDLKGRSPFRH